MAQAEKSRKPISSKAFSTFSTDDIAAAKSFYGNTLGLKVREEHEGIGFQVNRADFFVYPKDDHEPATYTVLNFEVDDIQTAVDDLRARGVAFESYGESLRTDEKGIHWGKKNHDGPNIAWFKDPAGNILSIIESADR